MIITLIDSNFFIIIFKPGSAEGRSRSLQHLRVSLRAQASGGVDSDQGLLGLESRLILAVI